MSFLSLSFGLNSHSDSDLIPDFIIFSAALKSEGTTFTLSNCDNYDKALLSDPDSIFMGLYRYDLESVSLQA